MKIRVFSYKIKKKEVDGNICTEERNMIELIYGSKGTGKTKIIIDKANDNGGKDNISVVLVKRDDVI